MKTLEEDKLRQLFKNRSNCYADADDVVQAMDEDCFISTINEWQQEQDKKMYTALETAISLLKQTTEYEVLDSWKQKVKELEQLIK